MFRVTVSGPREQEASFFTVVVWRDQAEHVAESLSKGSRIVVVGRLQQRSWTAEGPLRMAAPARSQLEIGPVQQDPSQRPDLRVDEEPRRRPGRTPGTIDVLLEEAHRTLLLPPRARRHPRSALTLQSRRRPPSAVPTHLG
jgi:hypothetical protein